MGSLREAMLEIPTAPTVRNAPSLAGPTLALDVSKGEVELEFNTLGDNLDTEARRHLEEEGLNPDEWEIRTVKTSRWTPPSTGELETSEGRSAKYSFVRRASGAYSVDEVLAWLEGWESSRDTDHVMGHGAAYLALIGDMQFGKMDGDGVDGTLARSMEYIDTLAARFSLYYELYPLSEVVIGFMGDHGEGFVSQNGANIWRTVLTNTEQQRLTRRVMAHAMKKFNEVVPISMPIHLVAVPGNHGDTIRVNGKGTTKYNDSYDTEALVSLADAAEMAAELGDRPDLERTYFYVPQDDEIVVVLDIAGTRAIFSHGHFHKPGKHFDWLKGQAFSKTSPMRDADLLVEGHLHHFFADSDSGVRFIGTPAVESESTWFRHRTGITGEPGCVIAITSDGRTDIMEVVR